MNRKRCILKKFNELLLLKYVLFFLVIVNLVIFSIVNTFEFGWLLLPRDLEAKYQFFPSEIR